MNIVKCKTFKADATIGLYKNSSTELISLEEFNEALLEAQQVIKQDESILLSVKTKCAKFSF